MNTEAIIAATLATKGIAKGSTVEVVATDPAKMPNLAKIQAASILVVGPRGALWIGAVLHDGSLSPFTRL